MYFKNSSPQYHFYISRKANFSGDASPLKLVHLVFSAVYEQLIDDLAPSRDFNKSTCNPVQFFLKNGAKISNGTGQLVANKN